MYRVRRFGPDEAEHFALVCACICGGGTLLVTAALGGPVNSLDAAYAGHLRADTLPRRRYVLDRDRHFWRRGQPCNMDEVFGHTRLDFLRHERKQPLDFAGLQRLLSGRDGRTEVGVGRL